jgi:hypothetical protein
MNGRVNRKRIRDFYDPAVEFLGHSYHPIWGKTERRFIIINFASRYHQQIFEMEFGRADLTELDSIPDSRYGACSIT